MLQVAAALLVLAGPSMVWAQETMKFEPVRRRACP
jgi:hypothetical protein